MFFTLIFVNRGSISGMGEKDIENEVFTPATVVRTQLPKYQETSRYEKRLRIFLTIRLTILL